MWHINENFLVTRLIVILLLLLIFFLYRKTPTTELSVIIVGTAYSDADSSYFVRDIELSILWCSLNGTFKKKEEMTSATVP